MQNSLCRTVRIVTLTNMRRVYFQLVKIVEDCYIIFILFSKESQTSKQPCESQRCSCITTVTYDTQPHNNSSVQDCNYVCLPANHWRHNNMHTRIHICTHLLPTNYLPQYCVFLPLYSLVGSLFWSSGNRQMHPMIQWSLTLCITHPIRPEVS